MSNKPLSITLSRLIGSMFNSKKTSAIQRWFEIEYGKEAAFLLEEYNRTGKLPTHG